MAVQPKKKDRLKEELGKLYKMRHSCAHMLAQAVLDMFPEAKLGIGPVIDNGFYYDFELPRTLIPEDLPILQKKMKKIMAQRQTFKRYDKKIDEALKFLKKAKQPYKVDLVKEFSASGSKEVSFYENILPQGNKPMFVDLCEGGHTDNTGGVGAFKLISIAGAYWRGDEKNQMLQRIYGVCFETQKELDEHLKMLEEVKKRDHRKLGKQLELFTFNEMVGAGLPLWLPKGAVMIEELEKLAKEMEHKGGYVRVRTPHITKGELFEKSGHLAHYKDSMYPAMEMDEGDNYYLKPMNCPFHHLCYKAHPKSYRDLPLMLAEYGTCYRYEGSGALFGLMRVRSMQMNDAHIYCTEEQFEEEFNRVTELYFKYFELFGIKKYVMRFSLHEPSKLGEKYVNEPKLWKKTEDLVRKALKKAKVDYVEVVDEAAFYGPKIDVEVWSAIGREFTLTTNQVDFSQPRRLGLTYTDEKGKEKTPLCIHRAPLSTHERMIGFLIEHYGGAFPVWLAPVQVQILTVNEVHEKYAQKLYDDMMEAGIRVELDASSDSLGKKIRNSEMQKIPYMIVIGDKEVKDKKVNVRHYRTKKQTSLSRDRFIKRVQKEIAERANV